MRLIRVLTSDSVTKSICAMKTQQTLGEQHNDHKDNPIHLYLCISNKLARNITKQRHVVQRHHHLVKNDTISICNLFHSLIYYTIRFLFFNVSGGMHGIHQSHHTVESQMMCKKLLHVKSLDDRCWIGKSYMTSKKEKIWV